jgi:hypothetical protein
MSKLLRTEQARGHELLLTAQTVFKLGRTASLVQMIHALHDGRSAVDWPWTWLRLGIPLGHLSKTQRCDPPIRSI